MCIVSIRRIGEGNNSVACIYLYMHVFAAKQRGQIIIYQLRQHNKKEINITKEKEKHVFATFWLRRLLNGTNKCSGSSDLDGRRWKYGSVEVE